MRIYVDDERIKPSGFDVTAPTYFRFAEFLFVNSVPSCVSFDHDLGDEMTGLDCLKLLDRYDKERKCTVSCHSANPVGKENILSYARHNGFTVI